MEEKNINITKSSGENVKFSMEKLRRSPKHSGPEQAKKVDELHWDARHWKSTLYFIQDEIIFIDRLLNSYIFEPNTPNLFERLQDYQRRMKTVKNRKSRVIAQILNHENNLGGMLECKDAACDLGFSNKHNMLKVEVVGCLEDFQDLKTEIFNYAGGILKKRKRKE